MRYQGSAAYDLDERAYERSRSEAQGAFTVVEGGSLDAALRSGVSHELLIRAAHIVLAIALIFAIGALRVALTAQTVDLTAQNKETVTQIQEAREMNDRLKSERSVLSSSERISRIATQNYGMVHAPYSESLQFK